MSKCPTAGARHGHLAAESGAGDGRGAVGEGVQSHGAED